MDLSIVRRVIQGQCPAASQQVKPWCKLCILRGVCHGFFSECFKEKVYLALRKGTPAQIRLSCMYLLIREGHLPCIGTNPWWNIWLPVNIFCAAICVARYLHLRHVGITNPNEAAMNFLNGTAFWGARRADL